MTLDKQTPYGGINISMEAIGAIAGTAAVECYGVVGMSSKNSTSENSYEVLKKENFYKGVLPRKGKEGYEVDLYIVVAFGVKITEVIAEDVEFISPRGEGEDGEPSSRSKFDSDDDSSDKQKIAKFEPIDDDDLPF